MSTAATAAPQPATGNLLRVLGVVFGVSIAIGNSIGVGIMRSPGTNAALLPNSVLIMTAWGLGSVYSFLGAWSLSELGAMIPSSGGYYLPCKRAFGGYTAFVVGWSDWLANCGAVAVAAILIGEYGRDLLTGLAGNNIALPLLVVGLITLMQWRGIRWGSSFQNAVSGVTALVFVLFIIVAFLLPRASLPSPAMHPDLPSGMSLFVASILVLQSVIYTFDAWYSAIYFGDEIIDPGRELPRSMLNAVLLLTLIYVLFNLALFRVFNVAELSHESVPIATAATMLFGRLGNLSVRVLLLISLVSLVNATLLCTSRIPFVMANDGWLSKKIASVNQGGTPFISLFLSAVVAVVFILTGTFRQVFAITAFFVVAKYALSYIAVIALRRREPETPRPYRAWGYPWTTGAAVVGSLLFLAGAIVGDRRNSIYATLALIASYPVYSWASGRRQAVTR